MAPKITVKATHAAAIMPTTTAGDLPLGLEAALLWAALLPTPSKFGGGGGVGAEDGPALPTGALKGESWEEG